MILETIVFSVRGTQEERQAVLDRVYALLHSEPLVTAITESGYRELEE